MKKFIFLVVVLMLLGCKTATIKEEIPQAENTDEVSLEQVCKIDKCRENITLKFMTNAGPFEQHLDLYWPVVQGEVLSLLANEKVFIEAELIDGRFVNFKMVEEITNPEKTIVFNFTQMEGKVDMMLSVKNPFPKRMKFHLDMIDFKGNLHKTSSCPVIARGGVFEMWPHAIPELLVSNIRALEESDSMSCVY
ncbi:MAG: hypothetical protein HWE27_11830 [Gammaproteobacteria bacterium]|nr:hypothetical protein [Gammaproteobacteria bacterium]